MLAMSTSARGQGEVSREAERADARGGTVTRILAALGAESLLRDATAAPTSQTCACFCASDRSGDELPDTIPALLMPIGNTSGSADLSMITSPAAVHTAPREVANRMVVPFVYVDSETAASPESLSPTTAVDTDASPILR